MVVCHFIRPSRRRSGIALVLVLCIFAVLVGFASLGVDWGRVQSCKTELQRAGDAAARAAVVQVSSGLTAVRQQAKSWAALNSADGQSVTLLDADIDIGTWANKTFTVNSSGNAVRVYARRLASRGNAVPLTWGRLIGCNSCDINVYSIAVFTPGTFGLIGLNSVTVAGTGSTDSFNSANGVYSAGSANANGSVASNGNITVTGSGTIHGNAYPGPGKTATAPAGAITGVVSNLTSNLSYTAPTVPAGAFNVGAMNISSGSYYVSAGDYYCTSLSISNSATFVCQGPVRVYCSGPITISGGFISTYNNRPVNLQFFETGSSDITLNGQADLYATVYAPQSNFFQSGKADIYGSVIAKTLSFTGSWQGGVHYDESLGTGSSSGTVSLVK